MSSEVVTLSLNDTRQRCVVIGHGNRLAVARIGLAYYCSERVERIHNQPAYGQPTEEVNLYPAGGDKHEEHY